TELHVQRSTHTATPVSLTVGRELREFSVIADLTEQRTRVTVGGWDVSGKSPIAHAVSDGVLAAELEGRTSGPGLLQDKIGERQESVVKPVQARMPRHKRRARPFSRQW